MHSLAAARLKELEKLPAPHRDLALAACQPSCSDLDLRRFEQVWATTEGPLRDILFNVFFAILDPTRIPEAATVETLSPRAQGQIRHVLWILGYLFAGEDVKKLPDGVFDIGSFVVSWVDFLHASHPFLLQFAEGTGIVLPPKPVLLLSLTLFMHYVESKWVEIYKIDTARLANRDTGTGGPSPAIQSTVGCVRLLVETWKFLLAQPAPDIFLLYSCICMFPQFMERAQLHEFLDACGTSLDTFTRLLKQHLTLVEDIPLKSRLVGHEFLSSSPLQIAVEVNTMLTGDNPRNPNAADAMAVSLASHHIFNQVFRVLKTLFDPENEDSVSTHRHHTIWLMTLRGALTVMNIVISTGPRTLHKVLRCGMVPLMLHAAHFMPNDDILLRLTHLLQNGLPPGLPYKAVLPLLANSIRTVEASGLGSILSHAHPKLAQLWKNLKTSAAYHEQILSDFRVGRYLGRRLPQAHRLSACDNPPCGQIDDREKFSQCSLCRTRVYCSRVCQKADWNEGKHRATCAATKVKYADTRAIFSKEQLAFFRSALHAFYLENAAALHCIRALHRLSSIQQQACAGEDPRPVIITVVSFESGKPEVEDILMGSALDPDRRDIFQNRLHDIDDWIDRAQRSNGRLVLHLVTVLVGLDRHCLVVPLRMNTSFLEDTALRLARSMCGPQPPPDPAEMDLQVVNGLIQKFTACTQMVILLSPKLSSSAMVFPF
ncbi:hypothetical protein MIND_00292200 [Mycena indigotica]|uniref:MYND-type domain-containing protein n=1 Tax=Mycena indigotica TaxID=2126181 RepID=A0A8H6T8D1_9AGAR|nr:uncharacterized protein MIND_00292200 [Mycena indigotica]KAF7312771.1 hypothetical protein MIND_00292200 [Mycena indigotica]